MKKHIIFCFAILFGNAMLAQGLAKKDFIKTEWYTDYETYYSTKDTITLYDIANYNDNYNPLSKGHVAAYYNNAKDLVTISLLKKGKAYLGETTFRLCGILGGMEEWTWSFNDGTQLLNLYADNQLNTSLRLIEKKTEREQWAYEVDKGKTTYFSADVITLTLVRIK